MVHVTDAGRFDIGASAGTNKGVVVDEVTDLTGKLQERERLGRDGLNDGLASWAWVLLAVKEVHISCALAPTLV